MNKPWLLIDASWLAHRAKWSLKGLSHNDMPTGILFGFFEQLLTVCLNPKLRSNKVALFLDSRQSYRKLLFSDYKRSRTKAKSPDDLAADRAMHRQMKLMEREVWPAVGIPFFRQTGLESDDLMASAALYLKNPIEPGVRRGVMITADGDLYQCISEAVHWYDPSRHKYLDPVQFFSHSLGLMPDQWANVKALAGCKSDNVPGVGGVGETTANIHVIGMLPVGKAKAKSINSPMGQRIYRRNLKLVSLPHARTRPIELVEPQYTAQCFFDFCKRHGIASYLKGHRRRQWERWFVGDFDRMRTAARRRTR